MAKKGYNGLDNMGNTSFMNAVIQALYSFDLFYDYIIDYLIEVSLPLHNGLANMFLEMYANKNANKCMESFREAFLNVENNRDLFPVNTENDCKEFYKDMLNQLLTEDNGVVEQPNLLNAQTSENAWTLYRNAFQNNTKLIDLFAGLCHYKIECNGKERHVTNRWETFWFSSIEIRFVNSSDLFTSVQNCLDISQLPQTQENICEQCGQQMQRTTNLSHLPQIFGIHLNLFINDKANKSSHKHENNIVINEHLLLNECYFQLFAFISHFGDHIESEHFVTTRRHRNNWIEFDDNTVTMAVNLDFPKFYYNLKAAYVLFYRRTEEVFDKAFDDFENKQILYIKKDQTVYFIELLSITLLDKMDEINNLIGYVIENIKKLENIEMVSITISPILKALNGVLVVFKIWKNWCCDHMNELNKLYLKLMQTQLVTNIESTINEYNELNHKYNAKLSQMKNDVKIRQKKYMDKKLSATTTIERSTDTELTQRQQRSFFDDVIDIEIDLKGKRSDSKSCFVRQLVRCLIPNENRFEYRFVRQSTQMYCVNDDNPLWYLFIDQFIAEFSKHGVFSTVDEIGSYLLCINNNILQILQIQSLDPKHSNQIHYLLVHNILPFLHNGSLKCCMYIERKGSAQIGQRIWWCFDKEPNKFGYSERFEFDPIIKSQDYFAIFLNENAQLLMEDFNGLEKGESNRTLFLDGTIIVIEGEFKVFIGASKWKCVKTTLDAIIDEKNASDFRKISHPIILLSAIQPNDLTAVWLMFMDRLSSRKDLKCRTAYLQLPLNENKFKSGISFMDWNDGIKYVQYYQSKRDWTLNIRLADDNTPFAVPYIGCSEPTNQPVCIMGKSPEYQESSDVNIVPPEKPKKPSSLKKTTASDVRVAKQISQTEYPELDSSQAHTEVPQISQEHEESHTDSESEDQPLIIKYPKRDVLVCAKSCFARKPVRYTTNEGEIITEYQFKKQNQPHYCVNDDNPLWYLYIDQFIVGFETKSFVEIGNYLMCIESETLRIVQVISPTGIKGGLTHYRTVHSVIPFLHNGSLKCCMYIEQKGIDYQNGPRVWWCFGEERVRSGFSEHFEFDSKIKARKKFAIFLHDFAKLLMEDDNGLIKSEKNRTLFLDGTIIVVDGEFRVYFGAVNARSNLYKLNEILDKKSFGVISNFKKPIICLSPIQPNDLTAVWHLHLNIYGGKVRKGRLVYLNLPKNVNKFKSRISVMNWNEGIKYVQYYQRKRDWTLNIRLADNKASLTVPYCSTRAKPKEHPVCIVDDYQMEPSSTEEPSSEDHSSSEIHAGVDEQITQTESQTTSSTQSGIDIPEVQDSSDTHNMSPHGPSSLDETSESNVAVVLQQQPLQSGQTERIEPAVQSDETVVSSQQPISTHEIVTSETSSTAIGEYLPKTCWVRYQTQVTGETDKKEYRFRKSNQKEQEYCVSYDIQNNKWYLFIENIMLQKPAREYTCLGSYLTSNNEVLTVTQIEKARVLGIKCLMDIHSVIPFIHQNELKCCLLVEEKNKEKYWRRRLWWRYGPQFNDSDMHGFSEFSVWDPGFICLSFKYFGIFCWNSRLVLEDYSGLEVTNMYNNTLFLNAAFIVIIGEFRVYFEDKRAFRYSLTQMSTNKWIVPNFNINHPIIFLSKIQDQNLAAIWHSSLDYGASKARLIASRTLNLHVPQKTDLNRIYYMDWDEGLEFVQFYQTQTNWSINLVKEGNVPFSALYDISQPPANNPQRIINPEYQ